MTGTDARTRQKEVAACGPPANIRRLVHQLQFADDRGVVELGALGAVGHPLTAPQSGEIRAVHREFTDQLGQLRIVPVASSDVPQIRHVRSPAYLAAETARLPLAAGCA